MVISKLISRSCYTELEFGQKLRDAMDMVDLYVTYDAPAKVQQRLKLGKGEQGGNCSVPATAVILNRG